jgi:hypothetical protein
MRIDLRGLLVVTLTVTLAPSLLAQTPGTDPVAATTEPEGTACDLLPDGSLSESFETGGLMNSASLSAAIAMRNIELVAWNAQTSSQTGGDATAPPPENTSTPSLQDLGFSSEQIKGNAEAQARLDKRSHMLKIHQRLGLITLVPLLATVITSSGATGKHTSASGRDLHGALGLVTAGLYVTAASYAIRAPSVPGTEIRGPIRLHKALAWIHGAGMILTPILGAMARAQLDRGEKVHGIAAAHSAVADVTIAAYAAAIGAVAIKF